MLRRVSDEARTANKQLAIVGNLAKPGMDCNLERRCRLTAVRLRLHSMFSLLRFRRMLQMEVTENVLNSRFTGRGELL